MTKKLTMGMVGSSFKENERRVAIHAAHFPLIDAESRSRIYVEKGFGARFGIEDSWIAQHVAGLKEREALWAECDIVMNFKPTEGDFPFFRDGLTLWGALHLVQGQAITQRLIDHKMTGIAMESMYKWRPDGKRGTWLYHTQSEFAGYCSLLHALQLRGIKGWHDQPRKIAVLSFGSVGRGAVHAARALEFTDITVFTMRPPIDVMGMIPTVKYGQYARDPGDPSRLMLVGPGGELTPFTDELTRYDVIVNAVYQDTDNPLVFLRHDDVPRLKLNAVVVDVSIDRGMGFEWARPTTFDEPMFTVGGRVHYYGVDHSPSLYYDTASLEHSKEAWPYVHQVLAGKEGWERYPTVGKAVEVDGGVIVQPKILSFQNREASYPHAVRK